MPNFIAISLRGAFPQICEMLRFCDFFVVLSCPGYTFFLGLAPRSNSWTDFNHWMTTHNFKGFKHPKTPRKRGRGFEPHSWLCGWSRITKFKLKMADDHHIAKCWKLAYQWTDLDETWAVAFHHVPDMSALMRLPRQRPLPSNDALKIQHLCGSGGRSRKTQHRIKAAMTVTWSNIKIF